MWLNFGGACFYVGSVFYVLVGKVGSGMCVLSCIAVMTRVIEVSELERSVKYPVLFIHVVEDEVFVVVKEEGLPKKLKLCRHIAENYPIELRQEVNQAGQGRNCFFICFYG